MQLLVNAFNPAAAEGVMCRDTVSVGWDGAVYDCDFNQQLGLPLRCAVHLQKGDVELHQWCCWLQHHAAHGAAKMAGPDLPGSGLQPPGHLMQHLSWYGTHV